MVGHRASQSQLCAAYGPLSKRSTRGSSGKVRTSYSIRRRYTQKCVRAISQPTTDPVYLTLASKAQRPPDELQATPFSRVCRRILPSFRVFVFPAIRECGRTRTHEARIHRAQCERSSVMIYVAQARQRWLMPLTGLLEPFRRSGVPRSGRVPGSGVTRRSKTRASARHP
jgi:hypothetical protein